MSIWAMIGDLILERKSFNHESDKLIFIAIRILLLEVSPLAQVLAGVEENSLLTRCSV